MSTLGTFWTPPNEYFRSEYEKRVRKGPLPKPEELHAKLRKLLTEDTNAITRRINQRNTKLTLKALCMFPPDRRLFDAYLKLIAHEDRHLSRLAHHLVREFYPLSDEEYKELVQVLDAEVKQKSPVRRAVALRTLTRVIKKKDTKRGLNTAEVSLRCVAGVTKQIRISKGLPAKPASKGKKGKQKKGEDYGSSDEEEKVDDGAGNMVYSREVGAKITDRGGKVIMGHVVVSCLRRCNRVNSASFGVEVYFFDLGLLAKTPSTVRNTIGLLESRLIVNPNAVGLYLHPRLPQFNPSADKKLTFEDLGAKVHYARILATLATDPNLEAFVKREVKTEEKESKGVFKFLFSAVKTKEKYVPPNQLRDDKLGVDFLEALIILLRNPSARVLLEVIIGLSRRTWTSWVSVPVPTHALYDAPDYDEAKLTGAVDIGDNLDGDESDEEFLKGDKFTQEQNLASELQQDGAQKSYFESKKEKRRVQREQQAMANAPFYLQKVGEGMMPALEVVMRRILGGMLKDEPCFRFGALRAAVAIARAKLYTDKKETQDILDKAKADYYGTGVSQPQPMESPANPPEGHATFQDDAQQHILEPLTKHLKFLIDDEPSLYVRCKAAEALLLFVVAGAGDSLDNAFDDIPPPDMAGPPDPRGGPPEGPMPAPAGMQNGMMAGGPQTTQPWMPPGGQMEMLPDRAPEEPPPPPPRVPLLIKLFRPLLCDEKMEGDVPLRALKFFLESIIFETPEVAPWLGPDIVELIEACSFHHNNKGWCGYLFDAWESVLSIGDVPSAQSVAASVRRCADAPPSRERIAATAAQFLRRRVLDLVVLTVGAGELMVQGVPTPLPQLIGTEMENYFSLLMHGILLGPSPESRQCFLDALGGAAVLAGDPFRITAYEKLCELRLARGMGLRASVDFVLTALDTLYYTREKLSTARIKMMEQGGITDRGREEVWLDGVWKLAAEASAAAGSLLACPPPPGWQPLGSDAAPEVLAAEQAFGDFRTFNPQSQPEMMEEGGPHQMQPP